MQNNSNGAIKFFSVYCSFFSLHLSVLTFFSTVNVRYFSSPFFKRTFSAYYDVCVYVPIFWFIVYSVQSFYLKNYHHYTLQTQFM